MIKMQVNTPVSLEQNKFNYKKKKEKSEEIVIIFRYIYILYTTSTQQYALSHYILI